MGTVIPGSEVFNSRPMSPDELRSRISPKLKLHTVTQQQVDEVDALTYEVIRHRLWAITEEMGEALQRMSGSQVVTEGNDFDFTICDELGSPAQVGLFNTGLVGSMDLAIFWTLEHRSENPGIEDGDMFLCNDPWIGGGLHQSDASVFGPIFHDGELFGWSAAVCHQLDLGGASPGSWTPSALDVFSESVPTPPIKVVRGGELQRDVADAWIRRSRLPLLVGLDLRAKIGAVTTARSRITALIDKYGANLVKAVMKRMMDDAEQRLRAKLRKLPNGTWTAVGYQEQSHEGDRGMYAIRLALTKDDDRLIFDFTGTDPQNGMINCPYPGLRGGILMTFLPILAGDIPWAAGGLLRCVEIVSEEGTLNNARYPAAVGKGPAGPAWATGNLVAECLGKMLDRAPDAGARVQAVCCGTFDLCIIAGVDERPESPVPFVSMVGETAAAGHGAQVDRDGVDTGGVILVPAGRAPDAEMTEFLYPLLTLWRREEIDSGGPGRQRGGMSGSVCLIGHGTGAPIHLVTSGAGKAANQNVGLAGGYPGSSQLDIAFRGRSARELLAQGLIPDRLDQLGEKDVLPCEGETILMPDEVVYVHWQSGGGYGDPVLRDPVSVATDVSEMRVSLQAAHDLYGVVIDAETQAADPAATAQRRRNIRQERLARAQAGPADLTEPRIDDAAAAGDERVDDNIMQRRIDGERIAMCRHCGHSLGTGGTVDGAVLARMEAPVDVAGPHIWADPFTYVDAEIIFRQLCCPGCGTAIQSSVIPRDHPLPADVTHAH